MINPWVIAAMIPAMVIVLIHFAIGPFGHPTRLHWHMKWATWPTSIRRLLLIIATITLIAGASHATGLWFWPTD